MGMCRPTVQFPTSTHFVANLNSQYLECRKRLLQQWNLTVVAHRSRLSSLLLPQPQLRRRAPARAVAAEGRVLRLATPNLQFRKYPTKRRLKMIAAAPENVPMTWARKIPTRLTAAAVKPTHAATRLASTGWPCASAV